MYEYKFDEREKTKEWVLGQMAHPCLLGDDYAAIGILKNGSYVGGLIFHDLRILAHGQEMELTAAGLPNELWLTPRAMKLAIITVFHHYDCVRLIAGVSPDNEKSIKALEKFGFVQEGRLRDRVGHGKDWLLYSLLRRECRMFQKIVRNKNIKFV